ncbi:alpha/beta hydrolase [Streptomyces sp. N2-109]|uniref:Alpha/beta hydrolase n=1 Tax=Streptomyces gossypii TaxID=2883101 RepID=A0ABT2K1C1_9ACTN|nr:alpha/beta hydrolase [Streptomyces gossypii]MCT2593970.1 alpha/beta hydrolase [Streptomyces gossypii]
MSVSSAYAPVPHSASVVRVSPSDGSPFEIAYERRGSGEPIVLLHGIGHHWQAWEPVLTLLAASHEVFAPDLPGFGASPGLLPDRSYGLPDVRSLLAAALDALGLNRPHVVGNSLGGRLALELGLHGQASSVTAFSPAGFWNEAERRYAFGVLTAMRLGARTMPEALVRRLSRTAAGRTALTSSIYARPGRRSPEAVVAEIRALRDAPGFTPTLAAGQHPAAVFTGTIGTVPDIPVTIGWGDRDRLLVRRQGLRAKRALPDARLVRLRGCGHVPMNDAPALVARIVLDTVRRVP